MVACIEFDNTAAKQSGVEIDGKEKSWAGRRVMLFITNGAACARASLTAERRVRDEDVVVGDPALLHHGVEILVLIIHVFETKAAHVGCNSCGQTIAGRMIDGLPTLADDRARTDQRGSSRRCACIGCM